MGELSWWGCGRTHALGVDLICCQSRCSKIPLVPPLQCRTITRQHLADYIASNYTAPRMVISAAGAVDHAALVAAAEKSFAKLPSGGKSAGDLVKEVGVGCAGVTPARDVGA